MTENTNESLRQDPHTVKYYGEVLDRYPDHEIVRENGIVRWKPKQTTLMLWNLLRENNISIERLWSAYSNGTLPIEELAQFYREIGYTLGGYIELFAIPLKLSSATTA